VAVKTASSIKGKRASSKRPYFRRTRKPSWRWSKRATAERVWRTLAKKSTGKERKEHNVEKYIQLLTTFSLTILVFRQNLTL